jgi:TPR repeat protein
VIFIEDLARAGGSRNPKQARRWFGRAAEQGDPQAMFFIARMLLDSDEGADLQQAEHWLERAGDTGFAPAYNELGLIYSLGKLVPADPVRAAAAFERGARLGDAGAQFNLAGCYLTGSGIEQDREQAAYWYRAAADQGRGDAQFNLALLLQASNDQQERVQGLRWMAKAADLGVPQAQYEIARRLRVGDGLPADALQAMHYYHEAAEQGHIEAQFSLGLMLEVGMGLDRPYPEEAAKWYRRLTERQAHAGAAHNLGILHAQGKGVAKDAQRARELFELAISLGGDDAMFSLGLLLLRGDGIEPDPVEAVKWALLAAQGDPSPEVQSLLDVVTSQLTPGQIEQGQARAASWTRERKTAAWSAAGQPA